MVSEDNAFILTTDANVDFATDQAQAYYANIILNIMGL